jgi:membrane associated rhomboid family serine protease
MHQAAVGFQCPECAGRTARQRILRPRAAGGAARPVVATALLAANVVVFLLELVGSRANGALMGNGVGSSWVFQHGALVGRLVGEGEWWRVLTAAFLHANLLHIAFNMYALWILGPRLEGYLGSLRFTLVYLAGAVSGSAGALLLTDANAATVGASGAIFGLLGALFVLERSGVMLVGPVLPVILINLVFTVSVPGISIGGHLGGLVGGAACTFALARFGRGHAAYSRLDAVPLLSVAALLVVDAALIAYAAG